jgi:hypothetical protein
MARRLLVQQATNELHHLVLQVTVLGLLVAIPWNARAQSALERGLSVDVQVAATLDRTVTYSDDGAPYRETSGLLGLSAVGNLGELAIGGSIDGFPGIFGDGRMALGGLAGWQPKIGNLRIQTLGEVGADRFSNVGGSFFSEQLGAKNSWLPYGAVRLGVTRSLPHTALRQLAWQGRGVGRELLGRLIEVGQRGKISRIYADVLGANLRTQRLCSRLGFTFDDESGGVIRAERRL